MELSFTQLVVALVAEAILLILAFVAGLMVGRKHPTIANLIAQDYETLQAALNLKQAGATQAVTGAVSSKPKS
jgi:hypothetical protein